MIKEAGLDFDEFLKDITLISHPVEDDKIAFDVWNLDLEKEATHIVASQYVFYIILMIQDLESKKKSTITDLDAQNQTVINEQRTQIQKLADSVRSKAIELTEIKLQLGTLNDRIATLNPERFENQDTIITSLTEELKLKTKTVDDLKRNLSRKDEDLALKDGNIAKLEKKVSELEKELAKRPLPTTLATPSNDRAGGSSGGRSGGSSNSKRYRQDK
jgi:TolA-binding protein